MEGDLILENYQPFLMHFMPFINYRKSKTIFKPSLNSHVYSDTLYEIKRDELKGLFSAFPLEERLQFRIFNFQKEKQG